MTRKNIYLLLCIIIGVSILVGCAEKPKEEVIQELEESQENESTTEITPVISFTEEELEKNSDENHYSDKNNDLDENNNDNEEKFMEEINELINNNELFIQVYKSERVLKLRKGDQLIDEYPIGLGFNPIGHKIQEGDGKTPEGSYYISVKNPNSRFYLSLGLSYPNIEDAKEGLDSDLITKDEYDQISEAINNKRTPPWYTPLGGEIMIHGHGSDSDWTAGCVAVDDEIMDILWDQCELGTKVFIYP